jgi:DNA primase
MNIFNHKWTRMNANKAGRASRPFFACGVSAGGRKQAGRLLYITALLATGSVSAETAMELFNPAAREYIVGNTPIASNLVAQALEQYPTDEKLQKLKELIEQQDQQNQQNQDQQQDQQNQQNQQDQQNQDQSDQTDQQQEEQEQNQNQNQNQEQEQEQEPQEAQPSPAQPHQAGEMSEEEAQQLLDSMKMNEKDQRTDLRPILGPPVRVDKDW